MIGHKLFLYYQWELEYLLACFDFPQQIVLRTCGVQEMFDSEVLDSVRVR